jgi:hypothetical protein
MCDASAEDVTRDVCCEEMKTPDTQLDKYIQRITQKRHQLHKDKIVLAASHARLQVA